MKYRLLSSMYYEDAMVYEEQYQTRYNSESTYRYNFSIGVNKAFVVINVNLLDSISQIYKLDKQLSRKILQVPTIAETQYTKRCIIDEIKMTNDIEGVISTRKEINELMDNLLTENKSKRLYGLVKKYVMLSHDDLSLKTCSDIRTIYDELVLKEVEEENPIHRPDGLIFRKDAIFIQSKTGKQIHTGLQPESRIIEVMTECLKMLTDEQYNPLISIAVFH